MHLPLELGDVFLQLGDLLFVALFSLGKFVFYPGAVFFIERASSQRTLRSIRVQVSGGLLLFFG